MALKFAGLAKSLTYLGFVATKHRIFATTLANLFRRQSLPLAIRIQDDLSFPASDEQRQISYRSRRHLMKSFSVTDVQVTDVWSLGNLG